MNCKIPQRFRTLLKTIPTTRNKNAPILLLYRATHARQSHHVTDPSAGRARGLTGRGARRSQPHRQSIWRPFYRGLVVANELTRPLVPDRRRSVLLCSVCSEHTRPPCSAGDRPPGPRQALTSSPTATPSLSAWSVLTLAQCGQLSAHRQKGGELRSTMYLKFKKCDEVIKREKATLKKS